MLMFFKVMSFIDLSARCKFKLRVSSMQEARMTTTSKNQNVGLRRPA